MSKQYKPRIRFCWECGRKLRGNHFLRVKIDGNDTYFHKQCGSKYLRKKLFDEETKTFKDNVKITESYSFP